MKGFQERFLKLAIEAKALKFGKYVLKSGRNSPYFFNASAFLEHGLLKSLSKILVEKVNDANLKFDMIFGPAYKGIFLATLLANEISSKRKVPVCFNRKEIKDHGEGGSLVGASPKGKILIIDDVLSSGLAVRESIEILKPFDVEIVGVLVALNRQERGQESDQIASEELRERGIPIYEIVSLDDMIGSKNVISKKDLELMNEYRANYRGADV